jgi:hypothetical protein
MLLLTAVDLRGATDPSPVLHAFLPFGATGRTMCGLRLSQEVAVLKPEVGWELDDLDHHLARCPDCLSVSRGFG